MVIKKETERKRFFGYIGNNPPTADIATKSTEMRLRTKRNRGKRAGE